MKTNIFPINNAQGTGTIDLYCLPSAGSSASMYSEWKNYAPQWLNICPIEYSGHGTRIREELIHNPDIITQEITSAILNRNKRKFILFGHSLGTALIWRIVKKLQSLGQESRLEMIVISGRRETSTLANEPRGRHLLPREDFIQAVLKYSGLPQELLNQNELLDFFLPILRNDFHLNDYLVDDASTLTCCPLIAVAGDSDPDIISPDMMIKWRKYSEQWLGFYPLPGNHFYLNKIENIKEIIKLISTHVYQLSILDKCLSKKGEISMENIVREEIRKTLNIDMDGISNKDNLIEHGLHSLAIMQLVESLSTKLNKRFKYGDFAASPTIEKWVDIIQKQCDNKM